MRAFFFMGGNPKNVSGVSWKLWKISRKGRSVTVFWGPVVLRRRRVVAAGRLQTRKRVFATAAEAQRFERIRIYQQLQKGYERRPRKTT